MSVFFRTPQQRSLEWNDVFGTPWAGTSFAGRHEAALKVIPVYAAVALIADSFSVLPLTTYRGGFDSTKRIDTPPFLLRPDPRISAFDWRYQLVVSLKLRGNAYGLITTSDRNGLPTGILWVHPDRVTVNDEGEFPIYYVNGVEEDTWERGGKLVHIREFVQPGTVVGLSPIANFRATYETAASAMSYGHDWFDNSAIPSGILRAAKTTLKPGQAAEAKKLFMESTRGREPVTLDQNWEWQQVSIAPEEAQFLQTIKATATQIAAIFRVAPEDIGGESGNSRTYSNREMDQEVFNVRTLLPLTTRVEHALSALVPPGVYVKFNMDALSRPNLVERAKAHTEQLKNGTETLAEAREAENRPPLSDQQIADWQAWYATLRSESESTSNATSTSTSTSVLTE